MVWLTELYGDHDPSAHGFIKVIGSVGSHDDKTAVPAAEDNKLPYWLVYRSSLNKAHVRQKTINTIQSDNHISFKRSCFM